MKIVVINPWFSENMGYSENLLPKSLASLGHEVHVVTSDAQIYYLSKDYKDIYEPFIGPNIVSCGSKQINGFTLHRLPHIKEGRNLPGIKGLQEFLTTLSPDIVQTLDIQSPATYEAALYCRSHNAALFTGSSLHASVFKGKKKGMIRSVKEWLKGANRAKEKLQVVNNATVKCYAIAQDVAEIAVRELGLSEQKLVVQSLGVDTELFRPKKDPADFETREQLRTRLGFSADDVVCIYTGRFSADKNPQCLAQAIAELQKSHQHFKGLFVGNGSPEDIESLRSCSACIIHPFVSVSELRNFYWAADIAVWPKQESTSQLDAMACGLPLVLSNRIKVLERIDGNGYLYEENNHHDLAVKLEQLNDQNFRNDFGATASVKVFERYSWLALAQKNLLDYQSTL